MLQSAFSCKNAIVHWDALYNLWSMYSFMIYKLTATNWHKAMNLESSDKASGSDREARAI